MSTTCDKCVRRKKNALLGATVEEVCKNNRILCTSRSTWHTRHKATELVRIRSTKIRTKERTERLLFSLHENRIIKSHAQCTVFDKCKVNLVCGRFWAILVELNADESSRKKRRNWFELMGFFVFGFSANKKKIRLRERCRCSHKPTPLSDSKSTFSVWPSRITNEIHGLSVSKFLIAFVTLQRAHSFVHSTK